MADLEKLTVTLEANVAGYDADLAQAAKITQQRAAEMEALYADLNKAVSANAATASKRAQESSARIAAGFVAMGDSGKRVVPTFDKVSAGMSSVGKVALGAQVESELLAASLGRTATTGDQVSHAIGGISTQGQAAFHAMRGFTEQMAQGIPITQAIAQQLNNVTYAASGQGGLAGAFGEAIGIFTRIFTPIRVLTGGLVALGAGAIAAAVSFQRSQSQIDLALTGVGNKAGITTGQIDQIAESVSKAGELSRSEATEVATAIASTGRVSIDATQKATGLAHAYSLVFGKDITKSAQELAEALSDPAKGIDVLNERTGDWSASQVALVKTLATSGNREAAAQIIIDGLAKSLGNAGDKTDFLTKAWTALSNKVSSGWTGAGAALTGASSPEQQLADAEARLKTLQQGTTGPRGGTTFGSPQQLQAQIDLVAKLTTRVDALHKAGDDSRDAVSASNIVTGIDPTLKNLTDLQTAIDNIEKHAQGLTPDAKGVVDNVVASLKGQKSAIEDNLALAQQRYNISSAQLGLDTKANAIELAGINARTPAQKAEIAYQQTLLQLQNTPGVAPKAAEIEAQAARTKTLAEAQHQLSEAQRDRFYQAGQSVEQAQIENSTIGQSIDIVTTLTQRFQLLAAAQAEAHKNGTVVSPEELAEMDQAAIKLGKLAQAAAALNLKKNTEFDISQLGRTQSEQNVYSSLQSAGLLTNGEIVTAQAKQRAELLRTREAMSDLADTEKAFATSFLTDLEQGKSVATALGDALNAVASKLLNSGIDALIAGATSSGLNKSLLSVLGIGGGDVGINSWAAGTSVIPGFADGGGVKGAGSSSSDFIPAMLSDGEFVVNADATKKHRALLEAINAGKVGRFASGGVVGAPTVSAPNISMPSAVAARPGPVSPINITMNVSNGTPAGIDKLNNETLPQLKKIIRSEIMQTASRSAAFKKAVR